MHTLRNADHFLGSSTTGMCSISKATRTVSSASWIVTVTASSWSSVASESTRDIISASRVNSGRVLGMSMGVVVMIENRVVSRLNQSSARWELVWTPMVVGVRRKRSGRRRKLFLRLQHRRTRPCLNTYNPFLVALGISRDDRRRDQKFSSATARKKLSHIPKTAWNPRISSWVGTQGFPDPTEIVLRKWMSGGVYGLCAQSVSSPKGEMYQMAL